MAIEYREQMFGVKSKRDRQFEILDARLIDIQGRLTKIRQSQHDQARATREQIDALAKLVKDGFAAVLEAINNSAPEPTKSLEVTFVFKVKNDHQDESFSIAVGGVTDAEGESLPDTSGLSVDVVSSDESVVSVSFDPSTNAGSVHFGQSGVASVTASVKNAAGDILGSGAADFTVTTGDPAAVSDVKIAFGGLTEEPTPEPPVEG